MEATRSRPYDMTLRAKRAAETNERIVRATETLLLEGPLAEVTLKAIAAGAQVTVQTVLRHMGSRDGCLEAVAERLGERVAEQRGASAPGDVDGAIAGLVDHYEADGRLVLNLLAQEGGGEPLARRAAEVGRAFHRDWVQRCFAPWLGDAGDAGDVRERVDAGDVRERVDAGDVRERVDALVAATDLYVWKLLRLDLGRSREAAEGVLRHLVTAVLEAR
jgi:AcrR family transcriptional regulator